MEPVRHMVEINLNGQANDLWEHLLVTQRNTKACGEYLEVPDWTLFPLGQ